MGWWVYSRGYFAHRVIVQRVYVQGYMSGGICPGGICPDTLVYNNTHIITNHMLHTYLYSSLGKTHYIYYISLYIIVFMYFKLHNKNAICSNNEFTLYTCIDYIGYCTAC